MFELKIIVSAFIALITIFCLYKGGIVPIPFGMAVTTLTDLDFQSNEFRDSVAAMIADKIGMKSSGVLVTEPLLAGMTGEFATIPHYNKLGGTADKTVANTDATLNEITQFSDVGVWIERHKAWGAEDWTKWITGNKPMDEIAAQVANFWEREVHTAFIKVLIGVFGDALLATHSTDTTYDSDTIKLIGITGAKRLLGDSALVLNKAIMNSKVWFDALEEKIGNYETISESFTTGQLPFLLGMNTTMDDNLAVVASVFPTYFAAPGAGIYSIREQNNEAYRLPLKAAGTDTLITRMSFLVHIPGVKWNDTALPNPTNTELATSTKWTKVEPENRNIQIVELKTL